MQTCDVVLRVMDTWRQRISDRDHLAEMIKKYVSRHGNSLHRRVGHSAEAIFAGLSLPVEARFLLY